MNRALRLGGLFGAIGGGVLLLLVVLLRTVAAEQELPAAVAGGICLGSAVLTLVATSLVQQWAPQYGFAALAIATVVRIGVTLGLWLVCYLGNPAFQNAAFLLWIVGWYFVCLMGETAVVLSENQRLARLSVDGSGGPEETANSGETAACSPEHGVA